MTRVQWIALALIGLPVIAGAAIVSGLFGPIGALVYGALLAAGVNAPHLFRHHDNETHQ